MLEFRYDNGAPMHLTHGVVRQTLPNGLTVLVKESHTSSVAALLVSIRAGYFQEEDAVGGIAHVIEHMLFKGTAAHPGEDELAREIRSLGGTINAATYYEETYYYIVVPSEHIAAAMELQADAIRNPLFDCAALAKEIEVIVQESLQKRDNPMAMLTESLYELAYDAHPIRRWRIGLPESLQQFTKDDLARFAQGHYRPENIVVTIVGDIAADHALELADRYWSDMERGEAVRSTPPVEVHPPGFRWRRITSDTRQRLVLLHFPAPPLLHPDSAALLLLSSVLSDGRSARLFRRLKEEMQLVNSAWASFETFEQMGMFQIGAECTDDDPLAAERAIVAEIRRLQEGLVRSEELARIKTRIESFRLYSLEEVFGMARGLSSYEQMGDYHLMDTILQQIDLVTAEEIQRVARAYLDLDRASLLEYLPADGSAAVRTAAEVGRSLRAVAEMPLEVGSAPAECEARETPEPVTADHEQGAIVERTYAGSSHSDAARAQIALPSGATLVFMRRDDLPVVSVQTLFRGGKPQETIETCGLTNLMLRTSLKGAGSLTAEAFAHRVEAMGSTIGGSLGSDHFGYGFKVRRDHLGGVFALLSSVLREPLFAEAELEREKQALFGELRRQQDNGYLIANELFSAAFFGEHPYGLPQTGIAAAIAEMDVQQSRLWQARLIAPENMVIAIVGDLEQAQAIDMCAALLAERKGGSKVANAPFSGPAEPSERAVVRDRKQTASIMGFQGAFLTNPDRYALDVLNRITANMGGRFFRAVRGEHALAYSVTSAHRSRRDAGAFITYTSTAPDNELRARELLLEECARLGHEPVTEWEMASAVAGVIGDMRIGTQTFSAQAGELAYLALNGLPLDEPERYLERVRHLRAEDIMDVAQRYLTPDRYWVGVVRGGWSG